MQVLVLALRVPEQLERAVGDHLVGVHVGRGAGAALDHVDHELLEQLALRAPPRRQADRGGAPLVEQAELAVGDRRRLLDAGERHHEIGVDRDRRAGDREVLQRPQRVHAVVGVGGHGAVADQVVLDARRTHVRGCVAVCLTGSNSGTIMRVRRSGWTIWISASRRRSPRRRPSLRPPSAAPAPVYNPAIARDFFATAGKEESLPAGHQDLRREREGQPHPAQARQDVPAARGPGRPHRQGQAGRQRQGRRDLRRNGGDQRVAAQRHRGGAHRRAGPLGGRQAAQRRPAEASRSSR